MADRVFERILNQTADQVEPQDPEQRRKKVKATEEDGLRKLSTGMTAGDAIKRILLAAKDRDYFRLLELPPPGVDALGRPCWDITPAQVSKAYRKLSILVHPDKNPGAEARQAFEELNEAHRTLKDPNKLEGILAEHLEAAVARQEEAMANAAPEERAMMQAQQKAAAKALRKAQGEQLQSGIAQQMRERVEAAKRKRAAAEKSQYRRTDEDKDEGLEEDEEEERQEEERQRQQQQQQKQEGSSSDEEDAAARRQALAKRRQKQRKPSGM